MGPSELFRPAIEVINPLLEKSTGSTGEILDLATLDVIDIDDIASDPPSCLFLLGLPEEDMVLERINIRRDAFLKKKGVLLIFLLTPAELRRFTNVSSSIWPLVGKTISLGPQHILDMMGDPLQERLQQLLQRIDSNEEELDKIFMASPNNQPDALVILRRWNSYSPILSYRPFQTVKDAELAFHRRIRREIRGGGYFFKWRRVGVVVDPGHNFIENLYERRFSIVDIDAIVISHDHLDHTADFESIIDLLHQLNKRGCQKEISVFLNPTTFAKYRILEKNKYIRRYIKLEPDPRKFRIISNGIRVSALRARHTELSGFKEALSLRFDLYSGKKGEVLRLGFTADTGWHKELASFYHDVDILVAHLGSIRRYELDEAKFYESHLGILGVFKLIEEVERSSGAQIVIISEFGEELIGLRDMLGSVLKAKFSGMKIIPGDIGHTVMLEPGKATIACDREACRKSAAFFFEEDGEIRVRCHDHKTTLGPIEVKGELVP